MAEFHRGTTINFQVLFTNNKGEEGTVTGSPTITIQRWNGSTNTVLQAATSMTQITGNIFGYQWVVPDDAAYGEYLVVYSAVVDGITGKDTSCFTVERYLKEGLTRRNAVYSGGKISTYDEEYAPDGATVVETTRQTFTYNVNDEVTDIEGSEP